MEFVLGWFAGWMYFAVGVAYCMRLDRTSFFNLTENEWITYTLFWPAIVFLVYVVGPIYRIPSAIRRWLSRRKEA